MDGMQSFFGEIERSGPNSAPDILPGKTLTLTRLFEAPRHLVYQFWTDPAYMALWWGIEGATNPICETDVRPGGAWRVVMRTAGGTEYPNGGRYLEVVEGEKLVYTDVPTEIAARNGSPARDSIHIVTFSDEGAGTRVVLECRFESPEQLKRMVGSGFREGFDQGLDRMARLLARLHRPAAVAGPMS